MAGFGFKLPPNAAAAAAPGAGAGISRSIKTPFQLILKIITNLCLTNDHMKQRLQQALTHMNFGGNPNPNPDTNSSNKDGLTIADIIAVDKTVAFYCSLLGILEVR